MKALSKLKQNIKNTYLDLAFAFTHGSPLLYYENTDQVSIYFLVNIYLLLYLTFILYINFKLNRISCNF